MRFATDDIIIIIVMNVIRTIKKNNAFVCIWICFLGCLIIGITIKERKFITIIIIIIFGSGTAKKKNTSKGLKFDFFFGFTNACTFLFTIIIMNADYF